MNLNAMITGLQIRIARNALRWGVADLARASGVSTSTIKRIEAEDSVPQSTRPNLAALKSALESAGIEFIGTPDDAPGIRIHRPRSDHAE
jgi:transcriptional regulator with XRE-family HTH domain